MLSGIEKLLSLKKYDINSSGTYAQIQVIKKTNNQKERFGNDNLAIMLFDTKQRFDKQIKIKR